jgi:REP element-mobilizing transposase RayT
MLETLHWLDQSRRIELMAAVVMPDHVHFVAALAQRTLGQLMHSLKSYSAQRINQGLPGPGRLWQPGYHDHALRAEEDLATVVGYCLRNPQRAGLVEDFHDYPHAWCKWPA